jgi:hypothetical protein
LQIDLKRYLSFSSPLFKLNGIDGAKLIRIYSLEHKKVSLDDLFKFSFYNFMSNIEEIAVKFYLIFISFFDKPYQQNMSKKNRFKKNLKFNLLYPDTKTFGDLTILTNHFKQPKLV